MLRGLPFLVGDPSTDPCFILLEEGGASVTVPVGRAARNLIVAHRLLTSPRIDSMGAGLTIARYVVRLAGGSAIDVPIRERFEIGTLPADRWWDADTPFLAWSDSYPKLFDRAAGPWGLAGERQTESYTDMVAGCFLWVWENPEPDRPIESVELCPVKGRCLVAALTLGYADEFPFVRGPARPVQLELTDEVRRDAAFDLTVDVDRGTASYAYPLPAGSVDAFLDDPIKAWGEPANAASSPAYTRVAAVPSATLSVRQGTDELGSVRWGDVEGGSTVESEGFRVRLIEDGRNWVHTTVLDEATGNPVPCRVHFRSPAGVPYQPHGHHDHVNSDIESWHVDVGGDVRLGRVTYAYIDGTCQGWLPRGEVIVEVARGFEYEPLRERVTIAPGQRELVLTLRRWTSMNDRGWFSGDSHVHFLSTQGATLEQQGEDLNVVNLLQSQWGSLFTNVEEFTGRPHESEGPFVTYVSQENRQHLLGHLILWGLRRPVDPWCSDGPDEAELGGTLETNLSHWADECHAQGGTVIVPHLPQPNGERAALVATGRADALEMVVQRADAHQAYYRYLNCGYRMPLVGGTDKMDSAVPVGLYRTYAHLGDEAFNYERWCGAVRAGRTFLSGGPIIELKVEGGDIGDVVQISGPGTVAIEARAEGIFPMHTLQLVQDGVVVASTDDPRGSRKLMLEATVEVRHHSWFAARCGGKDYFAGSKHLDSWGRGCFAHTSPIYVACGEDWWRFDPEVARHMLTLTQGSIDYIEHLAPRHGAGTATHHHGEEDHLAYLTRPLREAVDAIGRRMQDPSNPNLGRPQG
jgi:hypothetical protein